MPEDLRKLTFLGSGTLGQRREEIYKHLQECVELCIKNYSGKKELASEQDETILELCEALEDAFIYGLRANNNAPLTAASLYHNMQEIVTGSSSSGSGAYEESFWEFCQIHLTQHEKQRFDELKQLSNNCGRGRAFIRATLNENSLQRYVLTWLNDKVNLYKFYTHWSLFLNVEMAQEMAKLLGGLNQVLFALNIDTTELNSRTRLAKINAIKPLVREEPVIYAPTPLPAISNGAKRKVKERPITSPEDLLTAGHENVLNPKQEFSLNVVAKEEQPTLPTCMNASPIDPIEPELEFLKNPLPEINDIHITSNISTSSKVEDYFSDDNSSQYSKSSSANCCTIYTSVTSQNLAESDERLQKMTEHCSALETRVAQLSLENRQLLRRLKQIFEATGIDPSSTVAGYNFLITIPQVQLLKTRSRTSSYYAYEINITMRKDLEHWSVLRRYRDFHKLHQSLLHTHPTIISAIAFPPKKHFGNMNSVFVEERRAQLQIYLLNIVESLPQVEACKSKVELQKAFPFFRQK